MTTVKVYIRTNSRKQKEACVNVRFRLCDGRFKQLYHKSEFTVDPDLWDEKRECIKANVSYSRIEKINFARSIADRKNLMIDIYESVKDKESLTSKEFELLIERSLHPEKKPVEEKPLGNRDLFSQYDVFMQIKEYHGTERKNFLTLMRLLKRFELYLNIKKKEKIKLDFDILTIETLKELEHFIRNEYQYIDKPVYKMIYEELPETRIPKLRGYNTVNKIMNRFRSFVKWAITVKLLKNDPFTGFSMKAPRYGTPYYITIEERTLIANKDLHEAWKELPEEKRKEIKESIIPYLEIQRDIFVFHCMIGCRVGDLIHLTPHNITNGHVSYIARKTSKDRVDSIDVPLNPTAMKIVAKYWEQQKDTDKLFPFISPQKYNDSIKMIFLLCGITRYVTIWNSTLGREEQRPLNEIASSHLARRTFIGNLYKKVQDPNIIGKLSGHVEGSRAFARYRTIDDDMKQRLVNMLE